MINFDTKKDMYEEKGTHYFTILIYQQNNVKGSDTFFMGGRLYCEIIREIPYTIYSFLNSFLIALPMAELNLQHVLARRKTTGHKVLVIERIIA